MNPPKRPGPAWPAVTPGQGHGADRPGQAPPAGTSGPGMPAQRPWPGVRGRGAGAAGRAAMLACLAMLAAPAGAQALEGRVIVKFKPAALVAAAPARTASAGGSPARAAQQALAGRQGLAVAHSRAISGHTRALSVPGIRAEVLAERLARDPAVEYAVPDRWRRRMLVPNDPRYADGLGGTGPSVGQWYLRAPDSSAPAAINAQAAWDTTTGASTVRVAVLDTGVLFDHPDLLSAAAGGKLLPGYDMIADTSFSADGDGRDSDASDPGDAAVCDGASETSSWHGTQVSGLIGALSDNAEGMAGVGWLTPIVPVRVLGQCGGLDSDIVAGMRWAAGLTVEGLPVNPNPVRVVNLSLGGSGPCSAPYPDAIAELTALNVAVVAAAGNSGGHAVASPANCPGVIAVSAIRHAGTKVGFSDLGSEVAISAPGGNCVNPAGACLYPLLTTTNAGTAGPLAHTYSDSLNPSLGTSFATPLVAGVAALMLAQRPDLTVAELRFRLLASARAFPVSGAADGTPFCSAPTAADQDECYCTTSTCGAGMLDAAAAVQGLPATGSFLGTLPGVLARITQLTATPSVGAPVRFDAAATEVASGSTIAAYSWELLDGGGIAGAVSGNGSLAQVVPTGEGRFVVRLTVTDDQGRSSQATHAAVVVRPTIGAGTGDSSNSGGSDGGGASHPAALAALVLALLAAWAVRRPGPFRAPPPVAKASPNRSGID